MAVSRAGEYQHSQCRGEQQDVRERVDTEPVSVSDRSDAPAVTSTATHGISPRNVPTAKERGETRANPAP